MMAVVWPSARARPGGFTEGRRPDDGTTSPKHLKGTRLCVYERGHIRGQEFLCMKGDICHMTAPPHLKGTRLCVYERGHMSDDGTT